jgi:hypothetical protein
VIFGIIFLVSQAHIFKHQAWEGEVVSPHVELGTRAVGEYLSPKLKTGDARWYLELATSGYDFSDVSVKKMRNWVFFPLLPSLIALLSSVFGSVLLAGLILSNFCFFVFLILLNEYCKEIRLSDEQTNLVLWLISFFPVSYFFSLPLTESLFATLLCSSFLLLKRRRIYTSSFLLALCILTRPTGLLVAPAFLLAFWINLNPKLDKYFIYFLPSGLSVLAITSYFYLHTGDPLAFVHNQVFWDRSGSILSLVKKLAEQPNIILTGWNFILLNLTAFLTALIAVGYFIKKKEWDHAAMVFLPIAAAVNTGSVLSMTRFIMPLFPFAIFLAQIATTPSRQRAILVIFAALLGTMTLLFALQVTPAMA